MRTADLSLLTGVKLPSQVFSSVDGGEPPPPDPPQAPAAPPEQNSVQRRIDALTAEKWEERRRAEALQAELDLANATLQNMRSIDQQQPPPQQPQPQYQQPPMQQPYQPPPQQQGYTQDDVQRLAREAIAQERYNESIVGLVNTGRQAYQDFDQAVTNLSRFGNLPPGFVDAAMETGRAHEVLYALGRDSQTADRILSLSGPRQAVAIANLAAELGRRPPPNISGAPSPITPRVGGGVGTVGVNLYDTKAVPIEDWMAVRERQVAEKEASRRRR